ncbi:unnamed protein product [Medioppia subpectinata]|uniref:protein-serine/threonine phosphatase n=1 Tax=Medioppia subpectinata TaxID=1979941 RepID=A0A7R9Q5H3_9ACAR|nr:unnamed protein product [Medioppia subpectinata]CAG2112320.1 unnamed protein product [Medioppia subpectinata]
MGVYLSKPNTTLEAEDGHTSGLVFGAASMQGWRTGQEDAHIAIVDYDSDTALFGVFDGHGGEEVAKYCAQHLPTFIKSLKSYQSNRFSDCLEEAFLEFDKTLTRPEVIHELKILCGSHEMEDENSDDEVNEAILLSEEANLPIEDLMARYNQTTPPTEDTECSSSSSAKSRLAIPSHMKNEMSSKSKPISPFLRAKRNASYDSNHESGELAEECSSSSASTGVPSLPTPDSHSTSQPDSTESTNKIDSESNEQTNNESIEKNGKHLPTNNGSDEEPTSSIGDGVSSDDNHNNSDISKTSENDNNCEAICSEESITSLPYKGKGKHKKIISPIKEDPSDKPDSSEETDKPIYEYFLKDMDEEEEDSDDEEDFKGKGESSDDEDDDEEDEEEEETSDESEDESDGEDEGVEPPIPSYGNPGYDSGCTAVVALLKGSELFVANAGDSRCVVSRNGRAIEMSIDHKPEDELERNRVEKAGGKVTQDGRVNGGLNLSRAIGDHSYKNNKSVSDREQMITSLPDVKTLGLEPSDDFMVIACDGIWNSMTSQQVVDFVGQRIKKADKLSKLFRTCLAPNTHGDGTGCDNMTAVIVKFLSHSSKRKLEDNEEVNHSETVVTDGPENKKLKPNDCPNDDSKGDQRLANESDASV